MKTIGIKNPWAEKEYQVFFEVAKYYEGNNLAIQMMCIDDEYGFVEPYGTLSVNIEGRKCKEDCCFIDENNLGIDIEDWLVENGLGEPTGRFAQSGFCVYPEYKMNMKKILEVNGRDA